MYRYEHWRHSCRRRAAGPVIGGVLTGTLGWPSVFLVNVPLAAVAVVLTVVAIPADAALLSMRGLISPVLACWRS
jgi:MFS family permease